MSDVKKIATRESYGNALKELGEKKENLVVLDADLAGATKTGVFMKAFPDRHIDCGIAEANMTGIAAGLSTCGYVPFISTFAMLIYEFYHYKKIHFCFIPDFMSVMTIHANVLLFFTSVNYNQHL